METSENIVFAKRKDPDTPKNKTPDNPIHSPIKIRSDSLKWGVQAGLLMGAYLLLLHVFGGGDSVALKFLKYLFLFGVLGRGLTLYRKQNSKPAFFQNGIRIGALTTFFGALTLLFVNLVVSIIAPEYSFNRFNLEVNSPMDFLITSGTLFFEVLVFGMVGTFIWLQYLKRNTSDL